MSKFLLFLLGAVAGLIVGGALVFFYFGGAPRAANLPGAPIQAPDPNAPAQATATISLNQQFFDTVLATIFRDMNAPAFPLNLTGQKFSGSEFTAQKIAFQDNGCAGKITLLPEGSGVQSSVRLEDGKINAPLAFNGSTSVFGQCIQFAGWAQANMNLRFDEAQQTVFGQLTIDTVNLDGVNPVVSGFVTPIVQTSLNSRVNPITILRGQQIALNLPIAATGGTLKAAVKDVRAEIKESNLNLFITYDFQGLREIQPAP
ncbi:MAG TPA: hypothetical protein VNI84_14360 [Pyrinomonadaceae bacterium]|nr:hypothetical protein [Pyrinomonadaceae bacterium]